MQCNVIETANPNAFNIIATGMQDGALTQHIQNGMRAATGIIQGMGQKVFQEVTHLYNRFSSDAAINEAKQLMIDNGTTDMNADTIFYNYTNNFKDLSYITKIYAMANPNMITARNSGLIDGYIDEVINIEPDTTAKNRVEYGEVMDGAYRCGPNDKEEEVYGYYNCFRENGLTIHEQFNVRDLWDSMDDALECSDYDITQGE